VLYLTISEGDDPGHTTPILGSTDPLLIRGMADVLLRRLGGREPAPVQRLPRDRASPPDAAS
jgi:hypothetical protein